MGLKILSEHLNGIIVFQPQVFSDERGFFLESFRADEFAGMGLPTEFVQDNHSRSRQGVLRGMHFQWNPPQGKLIRVTLGNAFIAEIDIRPGSPTFGKWWGAELSAENKKTVWVPPGFANGFCALSDWAEVQYKCTAYWNKQCEGSIAWNDPEVGINWPMARPVLSEKDAGGMTLSDWLNNENSRAFAFKGL
jgi:dTDP-4-dehydrorhamnose 3,5-epimerase